MAFHQEHNLGMWSEEISSDTMSVLDTECTQQSILSTSHDRQTIKRHVEVQTRTVTHQGHQTGDQITATTGHDIAIVFCLHYHLLSLYFYYV